MPNVSLQTTLQDEIMTAMKEWNKTPRRWFKIPLEDRLLMVASSRNSSMKSYVSSLPDDEQKSLRVASDWL